VLGVLALLAVLPVLAQAPPSPISAGATPKPALHELRGDPFSATAEELYAASAAMPQNPDFDAQILLCEGTYVISAQGTLRYQFRLIYRVDSANGVKNWSGISMNWEPWYEKPAQLHARVLQPGGHFTELDQKTITDAPVNAESNDTYASSHVRRAPLPAVAVGSIVEQVSEVEEITPYFNGGSIYRFAMWEYVPIGCERITVELPSSYPYKDQLPKLDGLVVDRTESKGVRRTVYQVTSLPASHVSDIELDTDNFLGPMLQFSTGASWAAVASTYAALAEPQTNLTDAQSILPENLPAERLPRIRAIVARLHHEVRYTGVEFGAARLTPQSPAEVVKRHYGDCKDKATLLVAMLRSAGIPANLALLSTGPGPNVSPDLPGIHRFNHAIVYVPAAGKDAALWIDATAEYFAVGSLPYMDQGRSALIVSAKTTGLTTIPAARPEDSVLTETRTFTLAEYGAAHVEEVSDTAGSIDANYRASYGADSPKVRAQMEDYVSSAYLSKKMKAFTHGDPLDLAHPFQLTLTADEAHRGFTDMKEALVPVFPTGTVSNLTRWFATEPTVVGPDTSELVKRNLDFAQKSRAASYTIPPFISEQRTRVLIPVGFTLRSLPPNHTTVIGPATLTETYSAAEPGVVTATFRFNSGSGKLTVDQALAMRTAILELRKRDYVGLYFDQAGEKALAAGHIREALDADRALIAKYPTDALHHVRLARALLEAGIGNEAHDEARRATELDPKSATAFSTLAWILQHDDFGERFHLGFDRAGAIAAYQADIRLKPDDRDEIYNLAVLYEYDAHGVRYAPGADISAAIKLYRDLIERTKDDNQDAAAQYRENMLFALLRSQQYLEVDHLLAVLPSSSVHSSIAIASTTAQHGTAAGIAQASQGNLQSSERNSNLRIAALHLAALHLYPEAAEILQAGIAGDENAPSTARRIEYFRGITAASLAPLPVTNPGSPVQALHNGLLRGSLTRAQLSVLLSRHGYASSAAFENDVSSTMQFLGGCHLEAENSDIDEGAYCDMVLANVTYPYTGDDVNGYGVIKQRKFDAPVNYYVVREDGAYRILAASGESRILGNAILYALAHNNPGQAKAILNWKRDLTHKSGDDDDLAGPLLPRFWAVGGSRPGQDTVNGMRLAAISLLAGTMDAKPYLSEVSDARDKATGQRQIELDLLLAFAALGAEQPAIALTAAKPLLEQYPDSPTALSLAGKAYARLGDPGAWQALLATQLASRPQDTDLLWQQARAFEAAHDFNAALKSEQAILNSGKAAANDYNSYAWIGLFDGHLDDASVKAAQQANVMSNNRNFSELHTLACIYAAQGRTTEARQVLRQAIEATNQITPNSEVWYALGLIYEQYGARSAALTAYGKVQAHEFDDHTYIDPVDTYVLAQQRIHALTASAAAGH
jgi:tetratricopeptide (TPR) repeat protein